MKQVKIGTRESRLAVIQAEMAADYIRKNCPDRQPGLVKMKTTGDKILNKTLDKIGGKGLFVKELDAALLDGRTDISVHSLKDMPMETPEELPILGFSKREDPRDVLVLPMGKTKLDKTLPLGCSSARRTIQLKKIFPDMEIKSIRGNVLTRLEKLDRGEYSGLLLAAAGLKRLGLEARISRYFTVTEIIPAAGQGILAIQGRQGEDYSYLKKFYDEESTCCALAERSFVRSLDGGCSSPIAAYAAISEEELKLTGLYAREGSVSYVTGQVTGSPGEAEALGEALAQQLSRSFEEMERNGRK